MKSTHQRDDQGVQHADYRRRRELMEKLHDHDDLVNGRDVGLEGQLHLEKQFSRRHRELLVLGLVGLVGVADQHPGAVEEH